MNVSPSVHNVDDERKALIQNVKVLNQIETTNHKQQQHNILLSPSHHKLNQTQTLQQQSLLPLAQPILQNKNYGLLLQPSPHDSTAMMASTTYNASVKQLLNKNP